MIVAKNLIKNIGNKRILKGIDLEIAAGEFVTCFGPNGAGKSTTLKLLAMLTKPSSGELYVDGQNAAENSEALRRKVGVISHNSFLYDKLTAKENLQFYGKMYDVPQLDTRIEAILEQVGLTYATNDLVKTFSRGMQQRLAIARSLVHNPPILLMDEPYTGLDEMAKGILNSVLRELSQTKHTVFLITHDFDQGLEQSDQALILVNGRIEYRGNPKGVSREEFRQLYLKCVREDR
ncbi:MAG: heme ABC exporter ATP-binding protein CcmA [Peptococcaceae bacterium]|nr:heme ABC exporter ATP-binding protein CcmA [Peptococcaceae bacterium]